MLKRFVCIVSLVLAATAAANEGHELLQGQNESERAQTLIGILHASGKGCSAVSRSFFQDRDEYAAAYWNAECASGESYVIQMPATPQAKTRVLDCSLMEMIGVKCFEKFEN